MVDPLDTQNMVGRTPLVEKTVASHRENAPQAQYQMDHIQKDRQHVDENVQLHRESVRTETSKDKEHKSQQKKTKEEEKEQILSENKVELVQESPEDPPHKLDVEI